MQGKTLVIGMLITVILVCLIVVFAMKAQFTKDEQGSAYTVTQQMVHAGALGNG